MFSLTSFGTLKYDCIIIASEMFNFLRQMNNSVTTGLSFLLLIKSAVIISKTINTLRFFLDRILQYFHKHLAYHIILIFKKSFRIIILLFSRLLFKY